MCDWNLKSEIVNLKLIYAREYKGFGGVDETGDPDVEMCIRDRVHNYIVCVL